uniref:ADAMTS cysteine-rich domain-containing protein n=1 Tax=Ciona savignyi TaxID=51511 RepID=H2ZLJ6_CIOSA
MLWTQCDKTCGPGQRSRNRLCFTQECGRKQREYEFKKCNLKNCVKVWKWTPWSKYGSCSVTCGSGMQLRHRLCLRAGKCGGGRSMEAQTCTLKNCHDNGMGVKMTWLNWGIWGGCSRSCLGGVWYRYRICKKGDRLTFSCPGKFTDVGYCNSIKCSEAQNSPPSPMFAYVSTTVAHLCSSTSDASWVFGDFNGDGRDDALCKSQYGDFEVGFGTADGDISPTNWRGRLEGCGSHSGQIKVGDFNSDGASDLVCTDRIRRKITIHLSDKDKFNSEFYTGSFCTSDTDMLIVTNLDSDPRSDLLCIHSNRNHEMLINSFTI